MPSLTGWDWLAAEAGEGAAGEEVVEAGLDSQPAEPAFGALPLEKTNKKRIKERQSAIFSGGSAFSVQRCGICQHCTNV